jgi:mono/diheme cytochrome c family protein
MNRATVPILLLVGFGCAPGTGPSGLSCITREDIDPMKHQPRADPYGTSAAFPDGRAMRPPPKQTVARILPLASDPLATGMIDGGPVDRIPIALTREVFDRGRKHFDIFCAACHGIAGDGDSVVAKQMILRPPPSLYDPAIAALPVGKLFQVVSEGYGLMPPYRAELEAEDRWAVVAWVRALQKSRSAPVAEAPPGFGGEP